MKLDKGDENEDKQVTSLGRDRDFQFKVAVVGASM
jgi:hypothetical protein